MYYLDLHESIEGECIERLFRLQGVGRKSFCLDRVDFGGEDLRQTEFGKGPSQSIVAVGGYIGMAGGRHKGETPELLGGDGGGEMLTAGVVGEVGEDEPCRRHIEPLEGIGLTHKTFATVETGAPRGVHQNVAMRRRNTEPHMVLHRGGTTVDSGQTALAIDQTGLYAHTLAKAVEEFAVALADSGATLVGFVGRADLPGAVISDVVAKPEVDALRLLVVGRRRTYDAACQRGVVVRGGGDVVAHTIHGPLPSGSRLQPLSCCGAGEAEQEKDREACLAKLHRGKVTQYLGDTEGMKQKTDKKIRNFMELHPFDAIKSVQKKFIQQMNTCWINFY